MDDTDTPSLFDPFAEDGDTEDGDAGETPPQGEAPSAHIIAYRAHREREAHIASLHGGVADIWAHADGSPGCMLMGNSTATGDVPPMPEAVARIYERMPYQPMTPEEFRAYFPTSYGSPDYIPPQQRYYPDCPLGWRAWPSIIKRSHRPDLFWFRLARADAMVRQQIADAGGLDDLNGRVIRPSPPDWNALAERRRRLFVPPSQRQQEQDGKAPGRKAPGRKAGRGRPKAAARPVAVERNEGGSYVHVPLTQGYTARLPACDAPLVEGHNWHVVAAAGGKRPYAARWVASEKRSLRMSKVEGLTGPVEIIPPEA